MRRWWAIVRATAFELISDPLALLLTLSALALATVAPALHYHQFGEPSRMARDAGLSALLIGGLATGVFCTVKSFRREIESGTMQMALAHRLSRGAFFVCKILGCSLAYGLFALTIFAATLTTVNGAEIGAAVATQTGSVAPIWGRSVACAVSALVLPPILAAALNRFARFRFVPTAVTLSAVFAVCGTFYRLDAALCARLLPVAAMLVPPTLVFIAAAGAFAVRLRDNAATSCAGALFVLMLPSLGNYYLSDALARGGTLAWSHVGLAALLTLPLLAAFAALGVMFSDRFEVGE